MNISCNLYHIVDTLEALERGGMVKDYNANSTNLDSEDEEDPRTPASVSSQVKMNTLAGGDSQSIDHS